MEKNTLWLPDGYTVGTVIVDTLGVPHIATKQVVVGIHEIMPISEETAIEEIQAGADVLFSDGFIPDWAKSLKKVAARAH